MANLTVTVTGEPGSGKTALLGWLARGLTKLGADVLAADDLAVELKQQTAPRQLTSLVKKSGLAVTLVENRTHNGPIERLFVSLGLVGEFPTYTVAAPDDKQYTCPASLANARELGKTVAASHPHVYVQRSSSCDFPEELGLEEGLDLTTAFCEGYVAARGVIGL